MKNSSKPRMGGMGKLHNDIVALVDQTYLTPPEVTMVLRLLIQEIDRAFEVKVQRRDHGRNVEEDRV